MYTLFHEHLSEPSSNPQIRLVAWNLLYRLYNTRLITKKYASKIAWIL